MKHQELLADLRGERQSLRDLVASADLDTPTPAEGWTVGDTVIHLWQTDGVAVLALVDPQAFNDQVLARVMDDPIGFVDSAVSDARGLSATELLAQWDATFDSLMTALEEADLSARVAWFGPPMNPTSFATARLMEYWAHSQDAYDALGVVSEPTARLRHICHLGYRTRGFAYLLRGMPLPETEVGVVLDLPDGTMYSAGADAPELITGLAVDFCLVATQRRHPSDTSLVATGPAAREWLSIAQCFAGPPGRGREPAVN